MYVYVDTDTFAIERIQYRPADIDGVAQGVINVPKFRIKGEGEIDNLYNHESPIFQDAISAVVENDANLTYYLDADDEKTVRLASDDFRN